MICRTISKEEIIATVCAPKECSNEPKKYSCLDNRKTEDCYSQNIIFAINTFKPANKALSIFSAVRRCNLNKTSQKSHNLVDID